MTVTINGYVVTRPWPGSGVGSNLVSLAGSVWFARALGRAVIVDWRGTSFLKDKSLNYFTEFFEAVPRIFDVPVFYAPCPELEGEVVDAPPLSVVQAREVLRSGFSAARHIVLHDYHGLDRLDPEGNPAEQFWTLKEFYTFIRPRDFIANEIERWYAEHLKGWFVVGVNISTGNGEFSKGEQYYGRVDVGIFNRGQAFLARIERARRRAAKGLPRFLRNRSKIFFATDAYPMRDLLARLPNAVTRRTIFPPPGVGRVFCDYDQFGHSDREAAVDTIVDMFLLARCNALIRNFSVFNYYAQVVTACFNGNMRHIERQYARFWLRTASQRVKQLVGR